MSTKAEKMFYAVVAMFTLFVSIGLEISGSFVPFWMSPVNETFSELGGNVSFSLWTKRECWDIICNTHLVEVQWTQEECFNKDGRNECQLFTGTKTKPVTKCYRAFYCNITWHFDEEPHKIPSLLFLGKAFEIPSILCGFIALAICLAKFFMSIEFPYKNRLHVKAAYLTFSAMAGVSSLVCIIVFSVMLDKNEFKLGWAPVLPGVGGFLQLCVGLFGYLTWTSPYDDARSNESNDSFLSQSADSTIKPTIKPEEELFNTIV